MTPRTAMDTTGTGDIRVMKVTIPFTDPRRYVRLRIYIP